jgi:ABC-type Fe3+-hydroxamate transport system substrate-binding protein
MMGIPLKELLWLAPFTLLGLVALAPLRSPPVFPTPPQGRVVTDAEGVQVTIPIPFRAVVRYGGASFLETTHAPETLVKAGGNARDRDRFASGLMSRIYPEVLKNDALWNHPLELETLLAEDQGATYFHSPPDQMRRVGLPAPSLVFYPPNRDEMIFSATRIEAAAMGREERGEAFIADYQQAYADLKQELQPETLARIPRVIGMGSSLRDWNFLFVGTAKESRFDDLRMGVVNASEGFEDTGRQQDAERVLAMNPEMIFLFGESVKDFLRDPRWQGMKAVQDNRVYEGPRSLRGSLEPLYGLDFRPIWARWQAELAHPDRLRPKLRELLRAHFARAYGYRFSEDEMESLLRIAENKESVGYERFLHDNDASDGREAKQ